MITVIIPTFRRPHLLRRAIDSVLAQTYPHFLVRIYDNASNDGTEEVLKEYAKRDPRVQYHIHPENIGSNKNWQYGLNQVDTPFFAVLSDDDLYMPTFFEEAMRSFAAHPDAGIFIGGLIFIDEKQRVKTFNFYEWADSAFYQPRTFAAACMNKKMQPSNWTGMVFRREVQQKTGQLRVDLLCIDTDFLLRAYKEFSVVVGHMPCAIFKVHRSNISLGLSLKDLVALRLVEHKEKIDEAFNPSFAHSVMQLCFQKFARTQFQECLEGTEFLMKKKLLPFSGKILRTLAKMCLQYPFLMKLFTPLLLLRRGALSFLNEQRLKGKISAQHFASFSQLRR